MQEGRDGSEGGRGDEKGARGLHLGGMLFPRTAADFVCPQNPRLQEEGRMSVYTIRVTVTANRSSIYAISSSVYTKNASCGARALHLGGMLLPRPAADFVRPHKPARRGLSGPRDTVRCGKRLVFLWQTTSASTAPRTSRRMCCPTHCARYCAYPISTS